MSKRKNSTRKNRQPDTKDKAGDPNTIRNSENSAHPGGHNTGDNQWGMPTTNDPNAVLGIHNVSDSMSAPLVFTGEESK